MNGNKIRFDSNIKTKIRKLIPTQEYVEMRVNDFLIDIIRNTILFSEFGTLGTYHMIRISFVFLFRDRVFRKNVNV